LQDVSFTVKAGTSTALVGATGSGKSTCVRLMYRFYDLNEGSILVNGENIAHVTQKSLRQCLGIVPQDTVLFNNTLIYNLTYGSHYIEKMEELDSLSHVKRAVEEACKKAQLEDFIQRQPDGLNTLVGERGLRLSGGEKQRLSIARCLLRNPKISVFDEATSALDSVTEKEIQKALEVLKDKTSLVIAHRLSTIKNCEQIIVLNFGKILERGTHEELLENKGKYHQMWVAQEKAKKESMTE